MNNQKVPLILFSGGLDSSYLLQEKLKEGNVEVLYVKGVLNPNKMDEEIYRQNKIISILEEETGNKVIKKHKVDLGMMPFGNMEDQTFTQPPMWMMGALMVSDSKKHSELLIGYVAGDQVMCYIGNISTCWKQFQCFTKDSGIIPVNFPLRVITKQHILSNIHPLVMQHIWYCENPTEKEYQLGEGVPYPGFGDDVTEEDRDKWRAATLTKIRPCGRCSSCSMMSAQFHIWRKKEYRPYWQYLLRGLRTHRRQKKNKEEFKVITPEPVCTKYSTKSFVNGNKWPWQ